MLRANEVHFFQIAVIELHASKGRFDEPRMEEVGITKVHTLELGTIEAGLNDATIVEIDLYEPRTGKNAVMCIGLRIRTASVYGEVKQAEGKMRTRNSAVGEMSAGKPTVDELLVFDFETVEGHECEIELGESVVLPEPMGQPPAKRGLIR